METFCNVLRVETIEKKKNEERKNCIKKGGKVVKSDIFRIRTILQ